MTKQQLERFIQRRNNSAFSSNLQFQIDADACGFKTSELGAVEKYRDDGFCWHTEHGLLIEWGGLLHLCPGRREVAKLIADDLLLRLLRNLPEDLALEPEAERDLMEALQRQYMNHPNDICTQAWVADVLPYAGKSARAEKGGAL